MNAIHIVCLWSKYCSSRSWVSAAILKLVSAAEIMVRTTFQPISSGIFQSFFSKPVLFWIPGFLVNLLLEDIQKILDRMKLRDSKRVHLYAGGAQNGPFCLCPFHNPPFCLCSSSGLNSGRLILMYVLTAASLTILSTKDLSAFIFSASLLEVTPFLSQMVLMSWFLSFPVLCTARRPLSAFLSAVFLVSIHWRTR